tara:strand:- start:166 stop:906 length:741 start_codon:yes stop_codon:yes gene_type:complete
VAKAKAKYTRILLKISGESFKGNQDYGINTEAVYYMASQIKTICSMGVQVGVVVGGGNIWRGTEAELEGMDRATADYAGMLATVINSLALQDSLERHHGIDTRTQTAINIQQVAEPYIRRRATRHLDKKRVVIFAAGTGNPYMTTDTAAALRALEMEAEVLLMAKHKADGIYASDPNIHSNAKKFDFITYRDVIDKRLEAMDTTAISLCMENSVPIIVFNLFIENNIERIINGERLGTLIAEEQNI